MRILSLTNGSCWQDTWRAISGGDVLQDGGLRLVFLHAGFPMQMRRRSRETNQHFLLRSCVSLIYHAEDPWRRWQKKRQKKTREHMISRRTRGETLRLDMQLKRFAPFRDDVRDLVTLTVDRSLDAVLTQSHRICRNHWTVSTMLSTIRLPVCPALCLCFALFPLPRNGCIPFDWGAIHEILCLDSGLGLRKASGCSPWIYGSFRS